MLVEKTRVTYPKKISFIKVAWNRQKSWQNFESFNFFAVLDQKLDHKVFYRVPYKLTELFGIFCIIFQCCIKNLQ